MIRVVADCPVHLRTIQQAGRPIVVCFHPIVTLRREARNDR